MTPRALVGGRCLVGEAFAGDHGGVISVTMRDETASRRELGTLVLEGVPEKITVRDLIRLRVRDEVERHNAMPSTRFTGLVRPTDAEEELNGYRMREPRRLDWEAQADAAERAFVGNGFLMFVGGRQVEFLEELLTLEEAGVVSFVKLVALVGG